MRVLIISPHFPPANTPDMQRVRLILPYLRGVGVAAEVLAVEADQVAAPRDPWLAEGLPPDVPVHRVTALGTRWRRIPGLGNLTFRALRSLRRRGDELLTSGRFNLVVFSTTEFGLHVLGPHWKRTFGVPFVMDYQDPWVSDYYQKHPAVVPPGGHLKYRVTDWLNRRQEPRVLRECSGILSVSAAYPQQLANRYRWLEIGIEGEGTRKSGGRGQHPLRCMVLPFPGDDKDFDRVRSSNIRQEIFDPNDGNIHWVYIGVCPPSMLFALNAFFFAVRQVREAGHPLDRLKLHFVGTSYAAAGTAAKVVEPVAREFGLEGLLNEHTDRLPYSQALRCLLDAQTLLVVGSDDPGYTASKIYPYLLARKPLLAVFHEQSSVVDLMGRVGGGHVVSFKSEDSLSLLATRIGKVPGFKELGPTMVRLNEKEFNPHSAQASAVRLSQFFNECIREA